MPPVAPAPRIGTATLALVLLFLSACVPSSATATAPPPDVRASHIEAPDHVTLQMACTPTGPELCFNAIDDNCNGIIDEGCGGETGVLQWTIAWSEEAADVDLSVVDPAGETTKAKATASKGGLRFQRDCPADESCRGQNTENIYYDKGLEPPRGRYLVEVRLADAHGAAVPIVVHFGARVGAKTYAADVPLSPGDGADRKTFKFEL